jgi:hypothetical protein
MRYATAAIVVLFLFSHASAERPGMAFLRVSPDARGGALLGGAVVTVDDATALRHNPALLAGIEGMSLSLGHHSWVQDIRQEFAAFGLGWSTHHLGVGFGYVDYGAVEYREAATSEPLGTFRPNDLEVMVGYGLRLGSEFAVGTTLRLLHQKILEDEATGFCADLGAWKSWPSRGVQVGLAVQHVGSMGRLGRFGWSASESPRLPLTYRAAAAWAAPLGAPGLVVGTHAFSTPGIGAGAGLFGEYTYRGMLVLRSGLVGGEVASNWTVGTGMNLGWGSLDYAYVPVANDLGTSHRFSINLRP